MNQYSSSIILEVGELEESSNIGKTEYIANTMVENKILLPYMETTDSTGISYIVHKTKVNKSYGTFNLVFDLGVSNILKIFVNGIDMEYTIEDTEITVTMDYKTIRNINTVILLEESDSVTLSKIIYKSDVYSFEDFKYVPYLEVIDFNVSCQDSDEIFDSYNTVDRTAFNDVYTISFSEYEGDCNIVDILDSDNFYKISIYNNDTVVEYYDCVLSEVVQKQENNDANRLSYTFRCDRRNVKLQQ